MLLRLLLVVGLASLSETMAGTPMGRGGSSRLQSGGGGACAEAKRACFISPSPFRRGAFLEQGGCTMKPLMHASSLTGHLRSIDRGLISDRQKQQQQQQQQRRGRRASGAVAGYGYGGPIALRASASQSVEDEAKKEPVPFTLRRARKFEIDTLAALSTEAFTPRGAWYQVLQRVKFLLIVWDLQAQLYQRFTHWPDCIAGFKPPITESRYALLVAAKSNGRAIGVTELCVAPCPTPSEFVESIGQAWETAPYLSNLAVESNVRRQGIGQALVKMCEDLSVEWGHNVLFLHVEESNKAAIDFYATLGFSEATRDLSWYDRIGREDLQQQKQKLLYKMLEAPGAGQVSMAGTTETFVEQGDSFEGGATPASTGKGPLG